MACTFSSLKYPGRAPRDHILLRAFVGGALQPELFNADDAMTEDNVRAELASLLGVTAQPLFSRIWRHPNSMPQYHVGHQARIERIEKEISELSARELEDFRAWFERFDAELWDAEIERDSASGTLDSLADEALAAHRAGRSKPL